MLGYKRNPRYIKTFKVTLLTMFENTNFIFNAIFKTMEENRAHA